MLSEIDLKDWDEQPSKPLYDVPKETPIKTHVGLLWFKHVDGMYSLCYDAEGKTVHLAAWSTVNPFKRKDTEK